MERQAGLEEFLAEEDRFQYSCNRDVRHTQPARGFEEQMAVNRFAVASYQAQNLEAEFADTAAYTIHPLVTEGEKAVLDA